MLSTTSPPSARQLGFPNIALMGKAGSGKSTVAGFLVELGYERMSFADPLKRIAAELWGGDAMTDREKLQGLGVFARELDPETWVRLFVRRFNDRGRANAIHNCTPPRALMPVVVDDLRFPNEFTMLGGAGFVIVRVEAPRASRIDRLRGNGKFQNEEQLEHSSETALDDYEGDHTLVNDTTTDDLYDAVVGLLLKERRRR